jgi:hypothetical protein
MLISERLRNFIWWKNHACYYIIFCELRLMMHFRHEYLRSGRLFVCILLGPCIAQLDQTTAYINVGNFPAYRRSVICDVSIVMYLASILAQVGHRSRTTSSCRTRPGTGASSDLGRRRQRDLLALVANAGIWGFGGDAVSGWAWQPCNDLRHGARPPQPERPPSCQAKWRGCHVSAVGAHV